MDFSSHNPRSSNALSLAARRNDVPNLRRLLKKINPNCVDNRGWTCLHEAAFHDSLECLQIILKHRSCRPYVESHEGHTALYVACQNNFSTTRCIKYLLDKLIDIANYGSKEGFTPLHLVSRQGRIDVLQLLIDHEAMLDAVDFDGDTPLHEACMARQPEIVNILLHAGAQAEIPNEQRVTPLHMACYNGCLESIKYLYPYITNINVLDLNGETPLMTACHNGKENVIKFLLDCGADPNIENIQGKMALDLALETEMVDGFKMLFQASDKKKMRLNLLHLALSPSYLHVEIIDTLLASDLDPEYFFVTKVWQLEPLSGSKNELHQSFVPCYKTLPPLSTFLNVAEYIYKLSVDKLNVFFYLFLMKGLSVNADQRDEMPPLVWLFYCPHTTCFDYVLGLLVQLDCDVDYCSNKFNDIHDSDLLMLEDTARKEFNKFDLHKMSSFPDAFYASLLIDPETLPSMITYSLQCDPGYILTSAYNFGVIHQLQTTTISQLMKMIDSDCEVTNYEGFTRYVPSLKHLSRLQVRYILKQSVKSTKHYLDLLSKLPLPQPIKQHLRFL